MPTTPTTIADPVSFMLRLDRDLHARLVAAATRNERSLSAEIRIRLRESLERDAAK